MAEPQSPDSEQANSPSEPNEANKGSARSPSKPADRDDAVPEMQDYAQQEGAYPADETDEG